MATCMRYQRLSKVSKTSDMFIDPGAKVDSDYCTSVLRQGRYGC